MRMMWRTVNVIHALVIEIVSEVVGDVGSAVAHWAWTTGAFNGQLVEQPWLVHSQPEASNASSSVSLDHCS